MPRSRAEPFEGRPLLDIASYGRSGPGRRDRISREDMETILRTVRRAPEVMVKVLTRGATTSKAAVAHLAYLDRKGELEIETDDGEKLVGAKAAQAVVDGWDLDLEDDKTMESEGRTANHRKPRLVHKLIFSMPPGTPPEKVLGAVKVFAREEFALRNRYAMVLHTDEPHPHVHVVVKAIGEDGERLNIRKPMLRRWRHEFARRMREQGIDANATERGARGKPGRSLADGLYRVVARREAAGLSAIEGSQSNEGVPREAQRGWASVVEALERSRVGRDGADAGRFVSSVVSQPTSRPTENDKPVGRSR
jgi:hypothetical protein